MNAWIECPSCQGVLKTTSSQMEGPCPFCRTMIRVSVSVSLVDREFKRSGPTSNRSSDHMVGRGPVPRLQPVVSVKR